MQQEGKRLLFEGAQGALLDVDHGTYPYVTSSNCGGRGLGRRRRRSAVARLRAGHHQGLHDPRGLGPVPDRAGRRDRHPPATIGKEFGSVTGRPRRCGWFDGAALKRSVRLNGISGLCITKLDVLDGLETIQLGVGYRVNGEFRDVLPYGAHAVAQAQPVLEELPGWSESTVGITEYDKLPAAARRYRNAWPKSAACPSTGVDRPGPQRDHRPASPAEGLNAGRAALRLGFAPVLM